MPIFEKHLVYFNPPEKEIGFWNNGEFNTSNLGNTESIEFEDLKRCIGFRDEKYHHQCRNEAINLRQCPFCGFRDISKIYTRLDLTGYEHMEQEIMNRDYSVYLAYFGADVIKCGVTQKKRLETRLNEQGASYWIELMEFSNAQDAYDMERLLQTNFELKNAVRNSTKLKSMKFLDPSKLQTIVDRISSTQPFSEYLVDNLKINQIKFDIPENFQVVNYLNGIIKGNKGSILFFSNNGDNLAIDMNAQIGKKFRPIQQPVSL